MKLQNKKRIFYILSAMLATSLVGSYLQTPNNVYELNGKNINPNVLNFEMFLLKNNLQETNADYYKLYRNKNKVVQDIRKEEIDIPKDVLNNSMNRKFQEIYNKKPENIESFSNTLKNANNITPKQFENSIEDELMFNFFANSLEILNTTSKTNSKLLKKLISQKIIIQYGEELKKEKELTYLKDKDLFLEVLLINYVNNKKKKEITIENIKTNYIIKKITNINDFILDEKNINDITNKAIINYYFQ